MTMTADILDVLEHLGVASCDDIAPHLPEYTRAQIMQTLQNLSFAGRLYVAVRGLGLGDQRGREPSKFAITVPDQAPEEEISPPLGRPIASVWELGTRAMEAA